MIKHPDRVWGDDESVKILYTKCQMDHLNHTPGNSPEQDPPGQANMELPAVEVTPDVIPSSEAPPGAERQLELKVENPQTGKGMMLPPVQAQPDPLAQDGQITTAGDDSDSPYGDMPNVADDVDVIEQQWVNKAKEIIKTTKDNPHAQEQAMERLQIEYLQKRYGKIIKSNR